MRNPFKRNLIGKLIKAAKAPDDRMMYATVAVELTAAQGDDGKPDASRPKAFSMVAYTGGPLQLSAWYYPVVVDLEGLSYKTPMTMLGNHQNDPQWVAGNATSIEVAAHKLNIEGEVFAADTNKMTEMIAKLAAAGMKWQASIGASADTVEFVEAGKKAEANGQTFNGPIYISRKSTLREASFVVIGADASSSANVAASKAAEQNSGDSKMDPKLKAWLEAKGFDADIVASNASQLNALKAAYDAEVAAAATPPKETVTPIKAAAATGPTNTEIMARMDADKRERQIADICGSDHPLIKAAAMANGSDVSVVQGLVDNAIAAKKLEAGFQMPQILTSSADGPNPATVMEAALCLSGGMGEDDIGKSYGEQVMNAAVSRDFQGFGLANLMFASCAAAGVAARQGSVSDDVIRAAFQSDQRQIEAGFSTQAFTGILNNVANKRLLKAYASVQSALDIISSPVSVPDFKQMESYSMVADGTFQPVGPDGELKNMQMQDTKYTNQATTQGAVVALTRVMMINDDLNAFLRIPALLGRQAALAKEKAAFTLIMDNTGSFFSTTHLNYTQATTSALSIDALTAAVTLFMNQVDENGDPILTLPKYLLVPNALKVTAEVLYKETKVNETTTANKAKPNANPHAGSYTPVASPYLSNTTFNDAGSATGWYLFADPQDVAALEVAYLKGKRVPTIERGELDFTKLGAAFRGYFDFGVNFSDYRAANLQTGTTAV